ncbi:MAG TPA: choice-of-anchor S family protein [Candidatus Bathyarchaeia archaeon]|nr:choice-of-anchor S family protein [Candidatus Bathyarchaeia archaeon]
MTVRKTLTVCYIFFIITIMLLPLPTSLALSPGDTLTYIIKKSRISASIGSNSIDVKGISFWGEKCPERSSIEASLNYIGDGLNADYSYKESQFNFGYTYTDFLVMMSRFTYLSTYYTYTLSLNWEREDFSKGFYFFLYPYINPVTTTWSFFASLNETFIPYFTYYNYLQSDIEYTFHYSYDSNKLYYESWNGGNIKGSHGFMGGFTEDIDASFAFGNQFQIVIESSTGIVKGIHFRGWSKGSCNNKAVDLVLDYQYELSSYSLPRFKFGSFPFNYYNLLYILPPVFILSLIPLIVFLYKKRCKKKIDIQI